MKISINISTYLFYIILIISGYINYLISYLIVIFIHELGHIIIIKILGLKIDKIIINPCGGVIKTNISINIHPIKQLLISIAGILFQLIIYLIPTNIYLIEIIKEINTYIILFNLLPIYPLDGYNIYKSLIEYPFKYKIVINISIIISIIFLILYFYQTKNIIIFVNLYILNLRYILNYKYYYNKFLIERIIYKIKHKKIRIVDNIKNYYKCYDNYIYHNGLIYNEETAYRNQLFIDKNK